MDCLTDLSISSSSETTNIEIAQIPTGYPFSFYLKESRKLCTTIPRDMNDIKKVNRKYKLLMNMCDFISNAQYKLVTF